MIDGAIVGLLLLAVISIFTISSAMLTDWKIHYLTTGGNVLEKFHPATYFTGLAFVLLLIRNGDPIGAINRMFAEAKLLLIYLFCWFLLLLQMLALERPFTVIIDTFLLPVMLCLSIWYLSPAQRRPLIWAIHFAILLNVILGYYEYFSGHRLFELNLGANLIVHGEWRSSALLGHPLTASGVVAAYILALILRPSLCPWRALRLPLIGFCLASLMAFGGRTALITVLVISSVLACVQVFRILRGGRIPLLLVAMAICVVFAAGACIVVALDLGIFDKMLVRFGSDHGSTLARYATFALLSHFDWHELILGPDPVRASALQTAYGLNYGIEDFWISCIVQFGLVHTVLLSIGLAAFFVEVLQRASGAAWAIVVLILIVAVSSVSFSSKNIQLAQFVLLITLLLPRTRQRVAPVRAIGGRYRPAPMSV
ncbi:MAG TPA: VpsF family polysaccharide biosynthesis protein [Bradyrhizobium sp.]|uniref:VpsF family polysaccharide biosynthesis protein n=1 Tax=Bradyrhizobium sp. TaxID=376 RepID=UPI002D07BFF3|nr:VpsF family polysaccharide biosynthesis protein [Bradyrhizobium sp.]HLZ01623.1 VpsF family polysaccharide biosynthesis protein [Bradyrhizobium sp.]